MKKLNLTVLFSLFAINFLLFGQVPEPNITCTCDTNCQTFDNGTGNWMQSNANMSIQQLNNNNHLKYQDASGASWGYNSIDYAGDYSEGDFCLCWDYRIINDGVSGSPSIHPEIYLYSGSIWNGSNNLVKFTSTVTITENSDWVRICAPLGIANGVLPSNANGSWGGITVQEWNQLIHNVTGIAFVVDIVGSTNQSEDIRIDNVCLCEGCSNENAPAFITTDANGNPKQEFCNGEDVFIKVDQVDYPYAAIYLDTWLDPNYVTDFYNGTDWNLGLSAGVHNYSQLLRDKDQPPFVATDDYYIKLAVDHPDCGWLESFASFRYIDPQAPSFITTDANGNPKKEFCYGEDVYIKIDVVDYPYAAIHLDTWLDPNYVTDWYNGTDWNLGMSSGIYNYSQILRDKGQRPFDPVDDYYIKLAVDHPLCGWTESFAFFRYICCDEGNLAQFNANINTTTGTVSGNGQDLSEYGASHSFCIYSDENNDGVYELLDCTSSSTFSFPFQEGVEYWIVHRITTLCGDFCYIINFSTSSKGAKENTSLFDCSDFPLPCNLASPVVNCPFLIIGETGGQLRLSWAPVPLAVSYELSIVENDIACGCSGKGGDSDVGAGSWDISRLTKTKFDIPYTEKACFSYKVRAKCKDGSYSKWSNPICYPLCQNSLTSDSDGASKRSRQETETKGKVRLFPNPFYDQLIMSLSGFEFDLLEIQITNPQGQLVKMDLINPALTDKYVWTPTPEIESGMYLVTITSDNYRETQKVIFVK